MTREDFIVWESRSRDTIDVKRCYIDATGDLVAGILLSQIIYWNLPNRSGETRATIERAGRLWVAKKREDWWDECRLTIKQVDRAIEILKDKGFVTTGRFRFAGTPTLHISLNWDCLLQHILPKGENGSSPKGIMEVAQRAESILPKGENLYTETTTEITTETTAEIINILSSSESAVCEVFEYWKRRSGHKGRLTAKRKDKIKTRLKEFTVDELKRAIDGCQANPFYLGQNDRKTMYNYPETIFRDDTTTERHIEFLKHNHSESNRVITTAEERRNLQARRL